MLHMRRVHATRQKTKPATNSQGLPGVPLSANRLEVGVHVGEGGAGIGELLVDGMVGDRRLEHAIDLLVAARYPLSHLQPKRGARMG